MNQKNGRINLVTGACGFTGSHIVKKLLANGEQVIATDLARAFDHPKNKMIFHQMALDFSHPNCRVIPSDLTDKESLKKIFMESVPSHIFHTASLYDYSAPISILKKINIDGTINLLNIVIQKTEIKRFIHWSTCGVFGRPYTSKEGKICNIPFTELNSSPKNAPFEQDRPDGTYLVNDYSVTKWKQEQIVWKYHREKNLPLTVVRPAPLYGPFSDYGHGGIVLAINKGLLPIIPADSKNYITTSLHIEDMAGFAIYISDKDMAIGEDYNVVDDSIISYHEFLHYIALLLGRRIWDVPLITQTMLKPFMISVAKLWLILEKSIHIPRVRVLEVGSAPYMASSYWISNKKSKETGYIYRYPDVKEGLRDTTDEFRRIGWLNPSYAPKGIWQENL